MNDTKRIKERLGPEMMAEADKQFKALTSRVVAGRREREQIMRLRKYIHLVANHNQKFERCESPWCNPSKDNDPSLGITPHGTLPPTGERT